MFLKDKKERRYFLLFSAMSFGIFFLLYGLFSMNGKSMIWLQDGIEEYVPKTIYISEWLKSLFKNGKLFDFTLGLGSDSITYNSIWFYDPFHLLFLFGARSHYELFFHIGMALRLYAVGCSAYALLKHYGKNGMAVAIGALVYECNGFALFKMLKHPNFCLPMIALPLMILTMERLIEKKKWVVYVLTVALAAVTSLYFFYMCVIFLALYYVIRYREYLKKGRLHLFFKNMLLVAGYSLLALCLAGVLLLPDIQTLVLASRTGETHLATGSWWTFGIRRFFYIFIKSMVIGEDCEQDFYLGFPALAFISWVLIFCRKKRNTLKIATGMLFLFAIVPFFCYVLGAFGYVTGRWSYAVELLAAVVVCFAYEELMNLRRSELLLISLVVVLYDLIVWLRIHQRVYDLAAFIFTFVLLSLWLMEFLAKKDKKWKERILSAAAILNCLSCVLYYHPQISPFLEEYADKGKVMEYLTAEPISQIADLQEMDDFYRVSRLSSNSLSASTVSGYYGVMGYDNAASKYTNEFYRGLGLVHNSINTQSGLNRRSVLETILGVKYYAALEGKGKKSLPAGYSACRNVEKETGTYDIYQNDFALPLGFTYDACVSEDEIRDWNPLEKQNLMQKAVIINDTDEGYQTLMQNSIYKTMSEHETQQEQALTKKECIHVEPANVEYESCSLEDGVLTVKADKAQIIWEMEPIPNCEYYVFLEGIDITSFDPNMAVNFQAKSSLASSVVNVRSDGVPRSVRQRNYLLNLGYSKKGLDTCSLTIHKRGIFKVNRICVLCQPMTEYAENMKELSREPLEDIRIEGRKVSGRISVSGDKMLFLSIPYSKGWSAKIDGKEAELLRADYNFMAVPVSEGEHEVTLVYMTPGLKEGAVLSLVGVLSFFYLLKKERNRRLNRME